MTGQDGSYMAEQLLQRGYEVHGLVRRSSTFNRSRIDHLHRDEHEGAVGLQLHYGDVTDGSRLHQVVSDVRPTEVYHLAAQSHVRVSFDEPVYTSEATGLSSLHLLEAIRRVDPTIRFYQASTSEMFGASAPPQSETTPFHPRSPYGVSKVYAYWMTRHYREAYDMFAVNGILFNHESPRRSETFVTRKISLSVARIANGLQHHLWLGNLDAVRDWGYAPDYTEGMWRMLQTEEPEDFVLATGVPCTVRDFLQYSFEHVGLEWEEFVKFDQRYVRPTEVDVLIGDASKARDVLQWEATVRARELARIMVDADLEKVQSSIHQSGL